MTLLPLTAMRNQLFWILPIAAFALLFVMRGPAMFSFFHSASAQTSATAALNQTTFQELMQQGAILVDVRTSGEFAGGHMRDAVNIPVDVIGDAAPQLGATDRPVIVYCRSGNRSSQAARILRSLGYTQVHDIQVPRNW
jgi:rhodanese-related sulfurtransferase